MKKMFNLSVMAAGLVAIVGLTNGCVTNEKREATTHSYETPDGVHHEDESVKGHDFTTDPVEMFRHTFDWLDFGFGRNEYSGQQCQQNQQPLQVIVQEAQPRVIYVPRGTTSQAPAAAPTTTVTNCPETDYNSDEMVPDGACNDAPAAEQNATTVVYLVQPPQQQVVYAPPQQQFAYADQQNYNYSPGYYPNSSGELSLNLDLGGGRSSPNYGRNRNQSYVTREQQRYPTYFRPGPIARNPPQWFGGGGNRGGYSGSSARSSASAGGFGAHASAGGGGRSGGGGHGR